MQRANKMGRQILRGEDISHRFGGLQALTNVCFQIPEGVVYAVIGPNGAGKTTLLNIISGVQKGFSGRVMLRDELISELPPHTISLKGLTRTFQNVRLFKNMTVIENVMVGCHGWIAPKFSRAIFRVKATAKEEALSRSTAMEMLSFAGLDHRAREDVESLPLGEQKLLEIARSLAAKPRLLLLDEPGAGLNDAEMVKLMEIIVKIKERGIIQVVVEHNMQFIMNISDRIMVLNFGNKIAEGTADEVLHNDQVIEVYLGRAEANVGAA